MKFTKNFFFCLLFLFLFACNASNNDSSDKTYQDYDSSKPKKEDNISIDKPRTEQIIIKTSANDELVAKVQVKDMNHVEVISDAIKLKGKLKGNKRKYKDDSGLAILQAKSSTANKIKIKTRDGAFLWKIKIKNNKVSIANNEKGENPIIIKKKETGKYKVYVSEKEVGSAKINAASSKVKVIKGDDERFYIKTSKNSFAFTLLLIDEIPAEEKFVIMAELLARGL